MLYLRLPRTSELFAPERKDLVSLDRASIGSSLGLCAKEVILLAEMEPEANPSTETSSRMRTSTLSTLDPVSCPWPTLDPTPTDPSSSCVPLRPTGWMVSTLSSETLLREWTSLRKWRLLEATVGKQANL